MKPWTIDSKGVKKNQWKNVDYVANDEIREYMDPKGESEKLFLVGTKGCGKTLLLHKMAYEYLLGANKSKAEDDVRLRNLSDNLVEVIAFSGIELSENALLELKDHNRWKDIWTFAIGYRALFESNIEIPKVLQSLFEDFEGLEDIRYIVPHILDNYDELVKDKRILRNNTRILSRVSKLRDRYVLFLDGVDQGLNKLFSATHYIEMQEKDPSLTYTIWQAAQFGLLWACHDITTSHNRRIHVYATAREECLSVKDQMAINILSFCVKLEYTDEELFDIFRLNINRMDAKHRYSGKPGGAEMQMFGCERIKHFVPKTKNGELKDETGMEMVIRHTFRRPRELVLLGSKIYSQFNVNLNGEKEASDHTKRDIRNLVNERSNKDILNSYKKEIFPTFREDYLDTFLDTVKKNVFTRKVLEQLPPNIIDYLFRTGLLGYVKGDMQYFGPTITRINPENNKIPFSDYYLAHPSLDFRFQQRFVNDDFYDKHNIVGHGLDFERPGRSIHSMIGKRSVDDFRPVDIAGKTTDKWAQAKIFCNPDELFQNLFIQDQKSPAGLSRLDHVMDADRLLTTLLKIWGGKIITETYKRDLSGFIRQQNEALLELMNHRPYVIRIDDITERDLDNFSHRNFGRLSVLGMILALGYDNSRAKSIIRTYNIYTDNRKSSIAADSTFLRHAFYIASLPEASPISLDQGRIIWNKISNFERDFLATWFKNASKHDLLSNRNFNEDERHYLKGKVDKLILARILGELDLLN